jgi:hypothetical protein
MRNLWCLEKISILPLVISATGIVAQSLFKNFKILDLDNTLVVEIQKGIICFKIKNPPTVHSTSKIHPTTSPTFVFSVSASVRKKWGYERKLLDSR